MTASTDPVILDIDQQHVATITLNRPDKHNAFNDDMIDLLRSHLRKLSQDPQIKIVVLKSTGVHFSAGGDLDWLRKTVDYNREENIKDALNLAQLMSELYHFPKPTLAIVQGPAYGGAVGLMACCQIAIAASHATFCFSEVKLGLIPAVISPYIINAIGFRQARAYFTTAEIFTADTAKAMGLCHIVVDKADLSKTADHTIKQICRNGPRALQALGPFMAPFQPIPITPEVINRTAEMIAALRISNEGQEGLTAFLEKRKPRWSQDPHET